MSGDGVRSSARSAGSSWNGRRPRVLFISPDAVGERMAGLGIRYTEMARALGDVADVTIATGDAASAPSAGSSDTAPAGPSVVAYAPHAPHALRSLIAAADTIVAPPQWPLVTSWLRRSGKRVVFDLYDPETLETLELFASRRPALRHLMVALTLDRLDDALRTGHHFMCASIAQRDLWTGALLATRRLGPALHDTDRSLRSTLEVVPFGLSASPPEEGLPGAREAFPAIGPDDEIILWNGGIWPWLDAPTAIRAVARLAERRPGVRLVFMGRSSGVAGEAAAAKARALAEQLGLLGRTVLFSEEWIPYAERAGWLLGADCALATAGDHLETRYAFRTRLLDCLWGGLPIVCTSGDDLAGRVARDGLGAVAAPGDVAGLADGIERVLDRGRPAYRDRLAAVACEYEWVSVAEPLRRWVLDSSTPPRIGATAAARPAHAARATAYRTARALLGRRWPSL